MKVKLGDVCSRITDGSHNPPRGVSQSEFLMLSSKNIFDDEITLDDPRFLSADSFTLENKRTQIEEGDILLTIVGTVGRAAVVPDLNKNICLQRSVAVIKPQRQIIDSRFLMYQLQSMRPYLEREARGVAQKGIYLKQVESLQITILPYEEQRVIVSILDKVSELISFRKQQLAKLDELVKSRFVELFGGADYPMVLFENVCAFLRNGASIKQTKGAGGYPITRIETLSNDVFNTDRLGYADITDLEKYQSYVLHHGDILISHINSVAYLGRAVQYRGQLDTPIIHGMNLLCARIADSYNPTYIEWFFKTPMAKEYISTITKKAVNQASITTSDLKKMQVPNPPKSLQDQFAVFVEQTDKSKVEIQKSLEKLETLKKALMQEYFG